MYYFFYGTLLDDEVRRHVLGLPRSQPGEPARLDGYRRVRVPGKRYPALVAGPGTVTGMLFEVGSAHRRRRLRRFEGTEFREAEVTVATGGAEWQAIAFLPRRPLAGGADWSLAHWQRTEKRRFLTALAGAATPPSARSI
jgi:gamma-glutamylcyclotransferase (GGCT)/AIG2-like uncharacterized protein YtfP